MTAVPEIPEAWVEAAAEAMRAGVGAPRVTWFSGEFLDADGQRVAYVGDSGAIFDDYARWALAAAAPEIARAAKVEADRLAAALAIALMDAHPVYANTTGWRGGIGGQAITSGCSINDPSPEHEWMYTGMTLETPLRDYIQAHPEFDLHAARESLSTELRDQFAEWMKKASS